METGDIAAAVDACAWPEVGVQATPAQAEALEGWLFEAGALTVTLHDARADDDIEHAILEPLPGEMRLWDRLTLVGLFAQGVEVAALELSLAESAVALGIALPDYRVSRLPDRVWERVWMENFRPMQFGPRLWIFPTHVPVGDLDAVTLRLDPGLAFGSGTHATTALCLERLARDTCDTLTPLAGCRVLDYGCGSGVLGIAAALLGAAHVTAIDIDPQALDATTTNASLNAIDKRLVAGKPALLSRAAGDDEPPFDVLVANILMAPLESLAETFAELLAPGGTLVLSGLLESQSESLRLRYNPWFEFAPGKSRDGWALLEATRRAAA